MERVREIELGSREVGQLSDEVSTSEFAEVLTPEERCHSLLPDVSSYVNIGSLRQLLVTSTLSCPLLFYTASPSPRFPEQHPGSEHRHNPEGGEQPVPA